MTIERDKILGEWVVWKRISENALVEVYSAKTKKLCKEWLKKYEAKNRKKEDNAN